MKQAILLTLILGFCTTVFCQSGKLSGVVLDAATQLPLELATVNISGADSTMVAYQLSDKNGQFKFDKLPLKRKLLVSITYTGYNAFHTSLQLEANKADTLAVNLTLNSGDTNAVVVTATVPIRMNGDTLEINPAAFKMNKDAVVEEMLNQVSGLTIWSDGSITVNGRKVQNLFVDGKPFLGTNDFRVATQNLPKTAIDKIQLYQEYDRQSIGQQKQPQDSLLTMNIKLKEHSKKGYFGKAGAGYGSSDRFESDISMQMYDKKSSFGIGGGINNINKSIENLQQLFQNNTYRNFNPNLYSVGRFGGNGINKNHSIGGVYTHSFIESSNSRQNNRITINYNKSGSENNLTQLMLQNRTTIDNPQYIREESVNQSHNDQHSVGVNYVRTNSYNDNLSLNGSFNTNEGSGNSLRTTEVRDAAGILQSTNLMATKNSQRSDNTSVNVNFAKNDRDDPLKGFNIQMNGWLSNSSSERDVNSVFNSVTNPSTNTTYNRLYTTNNKSQNLNANLNYMGFKRLLLGRYNLFGIGLDLSQRINFNRSSNLQLVSDYDSTLKRYTTNNNISNQNTRELFEYVPTLALTKNINKWSERHYKYLNFSVRLSEEFKTDRNLSSIAKRNLARSFRFFRQDANMTYQYSKRQHYMYYLVLNYAKSFDYPMVDQLYTIVDDINAYDIRIGNPNLKNKINHNVNLNANFNTENPKSKYAIHSSVNAGYNVGINPVADSVINLPSGRRMSYFINADQSRNYNTSYNLNISRRMKTSQLSFTYSGSFNFGRIPGYVDGFYNISETQNLSNQVNLQYTFKSLLVCNLGQSIQQNKARQSAAGLTAFSNVIYTTNLGVVLNFPKNVTISSTLNNVNNPRLDKPTVLWNAFTTYRFMKQQGELKFSAMDLLKQYQNISNSVHSYGTVTQISNGLQQYFLLTFSYYPRKFSKKAATATEY